ncbi:SdpI family protein [Aegicerativicinus sediminis]|uniref:SdpI family protein n=1 Tax=Aegicerativicinus sediminis TaxID=2893202 RepID=UPI001E2CD35E|nr:SdpI family protein [Aegicerativicinus sediminis]
MNPKKELPLIAIVLLPIIYLATVWNELPQKVPVHWNINGEIDRYGSKMEILAVTLFIPIFIYGLFLVIPKIDPKNKIEKMGGKFQSLKFIMVTFMSLLAFYIVYSVKNESISNPNYILIGIGALFIILGNYFKTIQSNYFIGIRTPWTLENEKVWKETHKLGGKLWVFGGLLIVISCLVLDRKVNFIVFFAVTVTITLIPVIYSYLLFQKEKNSLSN